MAELTLAQQKALALAAARKRAAESGTSMSGILDKINTAVGYINPMQGLSQSLAKSLVDDVTGAPNVDARDNTLGKVDAAMRGAADTMSFGFADELSAAANAGLNPVLGTGEDGGTFSDRYGKNVAIERGTDRADAENRFTPRLTGQIAGALGQGVGMAKNGLSLTANAMERGAPLWKVMSAGAMEGGALGALNGLGSGENTVEDRLTRAAKYGGTGAVLGGAIPAVVAGANKAIIEPAMAYFNPEGGKDRVIAALLKRSGMTPEDVATKLQSAQADDQGMYMAADALGNPGQRVMSTAARTPTDARKMVVDALTERQVSQGDRLSNFMADAFDAPDTAAQRIASLTADRTATANTNYAAARDSAGAVDPSAAIAKADEFLKPGAMGVMSNETGIADNSIAGAVQKAKRFLTDGQSVVSDFNAAHNAKMEMDALIENASPTVQRQLIPIRDALDESLAAASQPYAAARDAYRTQSKAIEAVDTGKLAASSRMRAGDTVPQFNAMSPEEQAAFRAGYVDPKIAQIEAASMSPTTNKARPLMSEKTGMEFPAFAVPGKAEQLGDRIGREQRMFETANAALGGSKTADNLADMGDSQIDPGVISALMRGNFKDAALSAITQTANSARGMPPAVVERIIPALMQTDPALAREVFSKSAANQSISDQVRARVVAALLSAQGSAIPRLVRPAP